MSLALFQLMSNPNSEKLILFVHHENPVIQQTEIEQIEQLANEMNLDFIIKTNQEGLPAEVKTLPCLFFQNDKGRSLYYGRYSKLSRIKNFVRTSKMAHLKNGVNSSNDILVLKEGRADITAPIKITKLEGKQPKNFDAETFVKNTQQAIANGMKHFNLENEHALSKATKSFYFNIYPFLDEKNRLSITYEIFSQYNCVKPISQQLQPVIPAFKWKKRDKGLAKIGQIIEEDILWQIENSDQGDAFQTVANETKNTTWEQLGLEIVTTDKNENKSVSSEMLKGRVWTVEENKTTDEPFAIFSFLSPIDNYAGEIKALQGEMKLQQDLSMTEATGKFTVSIADITMGEEDFDRDVQNKKLKKALYPEATFEFTEVKGTNETLKTGVPQNLEIIGKFTLMDITLPVTVDTVIEPIATEGISKLSVSCAFQLPTYEKFRLKGPDGPSPAKDNLQFYMKFNLIESI